VRRLQRSGRSASRVTTEASFGNAVETDDCTPASFEHTGTWNFPAKGNFAKFVVSPHVGALATPVRASSGGGFNLQTKRRLHAPRCSPAALLPWDMKGL
jgi:hypothetical protein